MPRQVTVNVRPADGGRLITAIAGTQIGPADYCVKTNWRRLDDSEIRREGTLNFAPNSSSAVPAQTNFPAAVRGVWEGTRGDGTRALVAASPTNLYVFQYGPPAQWNLITAGLGLTDSGVRWQAEASDGALIFNNTVDLPLVYRVGDAAAVPMKELREAGIASVGSIAVYNGFLVLADVAEIKADQLNAWMNGATPYGVVPSDKVNRVRYRIMWSDYGSATNFAPVISGTVNSSDRTKVILDYPASSFPVGSKLAIIGGGSLGGTLGGGTGIESGVPVTAVAGATLTLSTPTDVSLTYPLRVQVTRFADTSTFSGFQDISDDNSPITKIKVLRSHLVVYRTTGIYTAKYVGLVDSPFQFTPAYRGADVPLHTEAVADLNGEYHLYACMRGFVTFDLSGGPQDFKLLNDCWTLYYQNYLTQPLAFFTSKNELTSEWWFHTPSGVLAFDYLNQTVSWIDEAYAGATMATPQGASTPWFIALVTASNTVVRYAYDGRTPLAFLRLGQPVSNELRFGAVRSNDGHTQLQFKAVTPDTSRSQLIAGQGAAAPSATYSLYGTDDEESDIPSLSPLFYASFSVTTEVPTLRAFFRNVFFIESLSILDSSTWGAKYRGRTVKVLEFAVQAFSRSLNAP